jgi:hypothetical protein
MGSFKTKKRGSNTGNEMISKGIIIQVILYLIIILKYIKKEKTLKFLNRIKNIFLFHPFPHDLENIL